MRCSLLIFIRTQDLPRHVGTCGICNVSKFTLSLNGTSERCTLIEATVEAGYSSWSKRTLLKLFLSPSATIIKNGIFMARISRAPKHRGHRPFLRGPGAKELALFRDELLLIALPQGRGHELSLLLRVKVVGLQIHEPCRLVNVILLSDSGSLLNYATGRCDYPDEYLGCVLHLATVHSLGILGQGAKASSVSPPMWALKVRHSASGSDPTSMLGPTVECWLKVPAKNAVSFSEVGCSASSVFSKRAGLWVFLLLCA